MNSVRYYLFAVIFSAAQVLVGCGSRPGVEATNEAFLSTATLDLEFYYPDSTLATDQTITVQLDSLQTIKTSTAQATFSQLDVDMHSVKCWDEDGVLRRFNVPLGPGRMKVAIPILYRIRAASAASVITRTKLVIPTITKIIFAVPQQ